MFNKKIISTVLVAIFSLTIFTKVEAKAIIESTPENPYVIAAIGDSITYPYSYATVIDALPNFTVENYGIPGSQVAGTRPDSYINRTRNFRTKADLILVMGGTNDYCAYATLANNIGTLDSQDTNTLCGAYNVMLGRLRANNRNAKIILMTPTKGKEGVSDFKNIYGFTLEDYANAVKLIAAYNGIPCIDLYHSETCDFSDPQNEKLMNDPIHPSMYGHKNIADVILESLTLFSL